jgi:predicted GIY-YIG superfamily endonuclease
METSACEIYVLKCENDKYYIGKTTNSLKCITNHFRGKTTAWTKLHRPLSVIEIIHNCDAFDVDKYTKEYMALNGIDNVRGGSYVKIKLDERSKAFLRRELITAQDRCYGCGQLGHFNRNCKLTDRLWSHLFDFASKAIGYYHLLLRTVVGPHILPPWPLA